MFDVLNPLGGPPRRPATPEDLEAELKRAVRAGELEEGAGRRLLGMVASMRTPEPDPEPEPDLPSWASGPTPKTTRRRNTK